METKDFKTPKEYLDSELKRVKKHKSKAVAEIFVKKIVEQKFKCCYCDTDIRLIQSLIDKKILKEREIGNGFRGYNLEVEHLDSSNTKDKNKESNIAAACYYCNNDKSNVIDKDTFKDYFGKQKGVAFKELAKKHKVIANSNFKGRV
jgi:5-methylcytosine-specific restriction endonuclease McrA